MKQLNLKRITAAAVLVVALHAGLASAAKPLGVIVSGTVTSVAGGQQITVNGTTYNVQLQGPALEQLQQVHTGEVVDVVLNGPPGAAGTQVVAIHVHNTP